MFPNGLISLTMNDWFNEWVRRAKAQRKERLKKWAWELDMLDKAER